MDRSIVGGRVVSSLIAVTLVSLAGCSSSSGNGGGSTTPTQPVTVTISGAGQVRIAATAQLTATVANTTNTTVTWQVNGVTGGSSSTGTISATGLYTPPSSLPSPNTVSITATSVSTATASAMATETILNPTPVIASGTATQLSATTVALSIAGSGFVSTSLIQVAGVGVTTSYISATQLQATITIVAGATSVIVDVLNPDPGSVASSNVTLNIFPPGVAYTVTAPRLTMHVGDLVPPCPVQVLQGGSNVGETATYFTGVASCKIGATSTSGVGTYPITVAAGTLAPLNSNSTLSFVNSTINVIAADGIGAALNDTIAYPSGFLTGPAFPMLNVTSNGICNLVGDNATDNTACLQNLLAYGGFRASAGAMVSTVGTTVIAVSTSNGNMSFTNISSGTTVRINGANYTVASVGGSTSLTLTTSPGSLTDVLMTVPTTVNTSGTTITETNGISFSGLSGTVLVNGVSYTIASVTDAQHIVTTTALPTLTGAVFFYNNSTAGFGRAEMQLYFPAGTYLIKQSMLVFGNYWTMTGDGPQKSVIRLAPNSAQFNNVASVPILPVIDCASAGLNDNFRDLFSNLGIDVGPGNPAAEGIQWTSNNMGSMQNVQIWSEDSTAAVGAYVGYSYSGPTLLKNVGIYGFQSGLYTNQIEYNVTLDQITFEGQLTQGCNCGMNLSIQHLLNDNAVTAITDVGRITLIDSELFSNSSSATGITVASSGSQIYLQNVSCTGYSPCEIDAGVTHATLPSAEWTGAAQSVFDSASAAASIAISDTETPIPTDPAVGTWTSLSTDSTTWCASITGSTSTTVYLSPGVYAATANITCTIPDTVNHIQMYNAHFNQSSSTVTVTFNVAGVSTTPLVIDGCMYSVCKFNHTGARTLVLRDLIGGYQASAGAGNVYLEDVGLGGYNTLSGSEAGPTFYAGQLVTARQLDIEVGVSSNISLYPKIQCQGASLWILGYKTEQDSPQLVETAGCRADIFGFFFYNLSAAGAGYAAMYDTSSSLFATGFFDWNVAGYGDQYWLTETESGVTKSLAPALNYTNSFGQAMNMLYSYGAGK